VACGVPKAVKVVRKSHFVPVAIVQDFFQPLDWTAELMRSRAQAAGFLRLLDIIASSIRSQGGGDAEILRMCGEIKACT